MARRVGVCVYVRTLRTQVGSGASSREVDGRVEGSREGGGGGGGEMEWERVSKGASVREGVEGNRQGGGEVWVD